MADLHQNERLIINALLDRGVFTSTVNGHMTKATVTAVQALKRPLVQQRINTYLRELVGQAPENYQENLVFLAGTEMLAPETVHVLLATLKAILILPEVQEQGSVPTQTVVRQVHSEVVDLDEREIYRQITALFVDRFGLFVPDAPVNQSSDLPQEINELWEISPNFDAVAQCMVDHIQMTEKSPLTAAQQVNRALLTRPFISRQADADLWETLQAHRLEIAAQWNQLGRFALECGEDYALLLDTQRQPVTSRAFVVAIAVAQQLGAGVPIDDLTAVIKRVTPTVIGDKVLAPTLVKQALLENGLAVARNGFYTATVLVKRFNVTTATEGNVIHAN